MDQAINGAAPAKPLWRRIADFPLAALLIAVGLFVLAYAAGILINRQLPPMDKLSGDALKAVISIGLVLVVYKLLIRRLGEHTADYCRLPSSKGTGLACCLVVAVHAGGRRRGDFRVYNTSARAGRAS